MRLSNPVYRDRIQADTQERFGGLRFVKQAEDGELYDMCNLCSDAFPLLQTREKRWSRKLVHDGSPVYGFFAADGRLVWSDNDATHYGTEHGWNAEVGTVAGAKRYARLNQYLVVMPDKKYVYRQTNAMESLSTGSMEMSATTAEGYATFKNGTLNGVPAVANTISIGDTAAKKNYGALKAGDAVTISGCSRKANNLTAIIREVEILGSSVVELRFYENTFTLAEGETEFKEPNAVTITRTVPDMDYVFENDNRLWGYKGSTIYASKLGDPFNWNVFDGTATDAWSTPVLSEGEITGACSYGGYPIFFKENSILKVYGSIPAEFRVSETTAAGVKSGCDLSLAEVDGVLFYLSPVGVCAYTGGLPTVVSDNAFPREWILSGVAGTDGRKYYLSAKTDDGDTPLLVYDRANGVWHREEAAPAIGFGNVGDTLCFMDPDGLVWASAKLDDYYTEEEDVPWVAEFADVTVGTTRKKAVSKIEIRADVSGSMTVSIAYDGGAWKKVASMETMTKRSVVIPVRPRRADHFRLRLEGVGACTVYSVATYRYVGSSR